MVCPPRWSSHVAAPLLNSTFLFFLQCLIPLVPHSRINYVYLKKAWQPNCNKYRGLGHWREGGIGEVSEPSSTDSAAKAVPGWLLAGKRFQRRGAGTKQGGCLLILSFPVLRLNSILGSPLSRFLQRLWSLCRPCLQSASAASAPPHGALLMPLLRLPVKGGSQVQSRSLLWLRGCIYTRWRSLQVQCVGLGLLGVQMWERASSGWTDQPCRRCARGLWTAVKHWFSEAGAATGTREDQPQGMMAEVGLRVEEG